MGQSMRHLARPVWLLLIVFLLCGCGGRSSTLPPNQSTPGSQNQPKPDWVAGNWQLSSKSAAGMSALSIAGGISQSGSSLSGAVHVSGSNCFDPLTTMSLTGAVTGNNISLTSTSFGGQIITFNGSFANNSFTGTYTIDGGCASGDHGNVDGLEIFAIGYSWSGTLTASSGVTFDVTARLTQGSSPSPQGSFPITGTATLTPCFNSAMLMSDAFPSGSFLIGTSVALEIQTNNGVVSFLGTLDPTEDQISGNYTINGGTCDQAGTGILSINWDY